MNRWACSAPGCWVPAFADPDFRAALADRFTASWAKNRDALCQWCAQFDVAYFNVMSFPVDARRDRESNLLRLYLGRTPEPADEKAYRFAIAARASGIVEMTADWSRDQIDRPGLGWVANRCFSAAVDHRVQDLLD